MKRAVFVFVLIFIFSSVFLYRKQQSHMSFMDVLKYCSETQKDARVRTCIFDSLKKDPAVAIARYTRDLEDMHSEVSENHPVAVYCHDIISEVARLGILGSEKNTILQCTNLCESGCFRGALEAISQQTSQSDQLLEQICERSELRDKRSDCIHAYGHVLARRYQQEEKKAWDLCSMLSPGDAAACGNGLFMQLYGSSPAEVVVKPPDALMPWCASLPSQFQSICYVRLGNLMYHRNAGVSVSASICSQIPDSFREDCFIILGKTYAYEFTNNEERVREVEKYCTSYVPRTISNCSKKILD